MPKKAVWVTSHLRDGVPVQAHLRLVEYEPASRADVAANAARRVGLRVRELADDDAPGVEAFGVLHDEWVAARTAFKNKMRRYTDKADRVFERREGLPIEGAISAPSGVVTLVDTLRDFAAVGVLSPAAFVSGGAMAFSVAFLPVATYANDRIASYTGGNRAIRAAQRLFKPYTGGNRFRRWLNRPEITRSIINGGVGAVGTVFAVATAAPIAPVLAGLTLLEVFHEHAAARDARNKLRVGEQSRFRRWVNNPRTVPRVMATVSAGAAAVTFGAPVAVVGGAAVTAYQLQKWLQRTQGKRAKLPQPDRAAAAVLADSLPLSAGAAAR